MRKLVLLLLLLLAGCTVTQPVPFETGEEGGMPYGCKEGRERGVDC